MLNRIKNKEAESTYAPLFYHHPGNNTFTGGLLEAFWKHLNTYANKEKIGFFSGGEPEPEPKLEPEPEP